MPSWIKESAKFDRLSAGRMYSKKQAAEVMEVSVPSGPRDWGGIVRFGNGIALFVTLKKGAERYAEEHRYNDRFDVDLLYWDSRASQDKSSSQVRALREQDMQVVAFARIAEKMDGRTQAFSFLGPLEFVDWWGVEPVHFTWKLRAFPEGLGGEPELEALAQWKPNDVLSPREGDAKSPSAAVSARRPSSPTNEGARGRVTVNRYERDPRARAECLQSHGSKCFVCGFDFGMIYGGLGLGFIFVHHRIPVAIRARAGEYELDPVRDLVPVCGNCHAMVHRNHASDCSPPEPAVLSEEAMARLLDLHRLASNSEWESVE